MKITVNADVGEGFGLHSFGNDERMLQLIDVANVACGYHASDPDIMEHTVAVAARNNVLIGAHPSFPDLVGFGRRMMSLSPAEVENAVRYQVGALKGFLEKSGCALNHIKPHGALYGFASRDEETMAAIARVARDYDAAIYGRSGTVHESVCSELGVNFVGELYVDLEYSRDGDLIIKRRPSPADPRKAANRVSQAIADGTVETTDGERLHIDFASVCVHSDPHNAADVVSAVQSAIFQYQDQKK